MTKVTRAIGKSINNSLGHAVLSSKTFPGNEVDCFSSSWHPHTYSSGASPPPQRCCISLPSWRTCRADMSCVAAAVVHSRFRHYCVMLLSAWNWRAKPTFPQDFSQHTCCLLYQGLAISRALVKKRWSSPAILTSAWTCCLYCSAHHPSWSKGYQKLPDIDYQYTM